VLIYGRDQEVVSFLTQTVALTSSRRHGLPGVRGPQVKNSWINSYDCQKLFIQYIRNCSSYMEAGSSISCLTTNPELVTRDHVNIKLYNDHGTLLTTIILSHDFHLRLYMWLACPFKYWDNSAFKGNPFNCRSVPVYNYIISPISILLAIHSWISKRKSGRAKMLTCTLSLYCFYARTTVTTS
jgi:hypothetical protein